MVATVEWWGFPSTAWVAFASVAAIAAFAANAWATIQAQRSASAAKSAAEAARDGLELQLAALPATFELRCQLIFAGISGDPVAYLTLRWTSPGVVHVWSAIATLGDVHQGSHVTGEVVETLGLDWDVCGDMAPIVRHVNQEITDATIQLADRGITPTHLVEGTMRVTYSRGLSGAKQEFIEHFVTDSVDLRAVHGRKKAVNGKWVPIEE